MAGASRFSTQDHDSYGLSVLSTDRRLIDGEARGSSMALSGGDYEVINSYNY